MDTSTLVAIACALVSSLASGITVLFFRLEKSHAQRLADKDLAHEKTVAELSASIEGLAESVEALGEKVQHQEDAHAEEIKAERERVDTLHAESAQVFRKLATWVQEHGYERS